MAPAAWGRINPTRCVSIVMGAILISTLLGPARIVLEGPFGGAPATSGVASFVVIGIMFVIGRIFAIMSATYHLRNADDPREYPMTGSVMFAIISFLMIAPGSAQLMIGDA